MSKKQRPGKQNQIRGSDSFTNFEKGKKWLFLPFCFGFDNFTIGRVNICLLYIYRLPTQLLFYRMPSHKQDTHVYKWLPGKGWIVKEEKETLENG